MRNKKRLKLVVILAAAAAVAFVVAKLFPRERVVAAQEQAFSMALDGNAIVVRNNLKELPIVVASATKGEEDAAQTDAIMVASPGGSEGMVSSSSPLQNHSVQAGLFLPIGPCFGPFCDSCSPVPTSFRVRLDPTMFAGFDAEGVRSEPPLTSIPEYLEIEIGGIDRFCAVPLGGMTMNVSPIESNHCTPSGNPCNAVIPCCSAGDSCIADSATARATCRAE